jgi:DNA replicative helicase MCM subunit Mcm2 (Cdc46/Mcm family)
LPAVQAVQNLVRKYQENYVESEESGEREFWVAFYNLPKKLALRGLKTQQIGRLVRAAPSSFALNALHLQ